MRWRIVLGPRPRPLRQRLLPFLERSQRLDRVFKRWIVFLTAAIAATAIGGTSAGRFAVGWTLGKARLEALKQIGLEPDRAEIDAFWRLKRARGVERTRKQFREFCRTARPALRHLFDVSGMSPENGIIRWGRADPAFVVSSKVFEIDDHGRSYRMRPGLRSIWLRQVTLRNGPLGLFLVPDTPEVRAAAVAAAAAVDEPSAQRTNSWGLRGPEPDPSAAMRGIVLGDSFMQAMFNGEEDTPPAQLERVLKNTWKVPVSILNTGHIGYSPEQYYFTLLEYGARFRPHFLVVSVCPNDFGEYQPVLKGEGDWYDEARYWMGRILLWCRGHAIPCIFVPVPCEPQVTGVRNEGDYPGRVNDTFESTTSYYLFPIDQFTNTNLRLLLDGWHRGETILWSRLYNGQIRDNHFSAKGAALWGEVVGRRVARLVKPRGTHSTPASTRRDSSVALPPL